MMRSRALVAAAACLLPAAACCRNASALAAPGVDSGLSAVTGSGGFDDAPVLGPGEFTDTLLPRETLIYAIRLKAGQHLRLTGTVDLTPGSRSHGGPDAAGGFALTLFSPLRQRLPSNERENAPDDAIDEDVAILDSERVVSFARAAQRATNGEDWSGPGLYHVVAAMSATRSDLGAFVEFPLRLRVQIEDQGPPSASVSAAGPLDAPDSPAAPAVQVRRSDAPAPQARPSAGLVAIAMIGALLLGALIVGCGLVLVGRFSRPP
jgi:hypothetical protein